MSRRGASGRHGHGAAAAASAGAYGSRILPRPCLGGHRAPERPACRYGEFGPRRALHIDGLLEAPCKSADVHEVSFQIWTSNSHLSVSDRCEIQVWIFPDGPPWSRDTLVNA